MSTFGLTMIVGPNEAEELDRCIDSFGAKSFDKIAIALTSQDAKVEEVARKYTDLIQHFDWTSARYPFGDFAGARNASLAMLDTDYWMWLDADDVMLDQYRDNWERLVESIKTGKLFAERGEIDILACPYAVVHDLNGIPQVVFMKERIFKRREGMQWERPVHEHLTMLDTPPSKVRNVIVSHMPAKANFVSAIRNVRILKAEYEYQISQCGEVESAIKYYLGRDLLQASQVEEGIKYLTELVDKFEGGFDELCNIAIDILGYYAYRQSTRFKPIIDDVNLEHQNEIESWARYAIACSQDFAEPFVILGDLYTLRGFIDRAEALYLTAMTKATNLRQVQSLPFYSEIPAERLTRIYFSQGKYEKALYYNKTALKGDPNNQEHKRLRSVIMEKLNEQLGSD